MPVSFREDIYNDIYIIYIYKWLEINLVNQRVISPLISGVMGSDLQLLEGPTLWYLFNVDIFKGVLRVSHVELLHLYIETGFRILI